MPPVRQPRNQTASKPEQQTKPKPEEQLKPQAEVVDCEFIETAGAKGELVPMLAKRSVLRDMADRYGMEPMNFQEVVMATCFPVKKDERQVSPAEFAAFLLVAKEYRLNPLTREIYGFRAKSGAIVPIVSIDGWLRIINEHPQMDGMEFDDHLDEKDAMYAVTCRIHRKDRSHPMVITEYMKECMRPTEPWQKWPYRMLRHKSAIQGGRYAFGFAGIYDPDEAERMGIDVSAMTDVTPRAQNGQGAPPAPKLAPPDMRPPAPKNNAPASPPADQGMAPAASTPPQPDVSSGNTNPDPETKGPAGAGTAAKDTGEVYAEASGAKTATGPAVARAKAAQEAAAADDGPIPDDNGLIPNPAQEPGGFLAWLDRALGAVEPGPGCDGDFDIIWTEAETALAKDGVEADTTATAEGLRRKHEKRLGLGG